jgi:hypothetical protein
LRNGPWMRQFLEAGGPRNGKYGPALEIYAQIQFESTKTTHPVLSRLALAVALELADPHPLFMEQGAMTNALQRYQHYQQAYLTGDLDPAFGQFTVWELRHAINSDATEDELAWGRASLQAYRPDLALIADNNEQWRYCYLVKSDVTYAKPDWYKSPRSYDQILSGGGKVRLLCPCVSRLVSNKERVPWCWLCADTHILAADGNCPCPAFCTVRPSSVVWSLYLQSLWDSYVGRPTTRSRRHDALDAVRLGHLPRRRH